MKTPFAGALVAALALGAASAAPLPSQDRILAWTPAEQAIGYRSMEKISPFRTVARGPTVSPLPHARGRFDVSYAFADNTWNTADFMAATNVSGLIIVHHGRVLLERYGLGRTERDRWTSFSVAKSVTSTLVAAAIHDGYIKSLSAPVTDYLPELRHTAYEGVTVGDLITMRSGVAWNEDYADPKSDVARFALEPPRADGADPVVAYMARLPRAHPPGTTFHYDTGETELVGVLVARATKRPLTQYLSETIWSKIGTEQDAVWLLDAAGQEHGGCCISATLRDYARFGLFFMHGGLANGRPALPPGWVRAASASHVATGDGPEGYGYAWWVHPDGSYSAEGIFGQQIWLDPADDLVIVFNSAWRSADDDSDWAAQHAYAEAVKRKLAR